MARDFVLGNRGRDALLVAGGVTLSRFGQLFEGAHLAHVLPSNRQGAVDVADRCRQVGVHAGVSPSSVWGSGPSVPSGPGGTLGPLGPFSGTGM